MPHSNDSEFSVGDSLKRFHKKATAGDLGCKCANRMHYTRLVSVDTMTIMYVQRCQAQ